MITQCIRMLTLFGFITTSSLPTVDIIIDPGHGGIDSGATYADVEEKNINLAVAQTLQNMLVEKGYHVILTRDTDVALSDSSIHKHMKSRHRRDLLQRKEIASHFQPYLFISLHVNAGSKVKRGAQLLYPADGKSYLIAHILQRHLNHALGVAGSPIKGKHYFVLNQIDAPAVIVEMGYLSNPIEREDLQDPKHQFRIAKALAEGIEEIMRLYPW